MRISGMVLMLLAAVTAVAADQVTISESQLQHLEIVVQVPEVVQSVPLGLVPAQVTVPPQNDRVISAPLAGVVERVEVARGDKVTRGQVLVRIDSPELLQHQQHLLDTWQELNVAEARHQREAKLYQAGIIAKSRWLETEKRWRQARTAFVQARCELEVMGLSATAIDRLLKTARFDSHLDLHAPVTGVVSTRMVVAGQRVVRADALLRLTVLAPLWLEMAVPVALAEKLQPGAWVRTEAHGAEGRVFLIGTLVDPANQTVLVRAELTKPRGLRPGRKVNARLALPAAGMLKLPRGALIEHQGRHFVFVHGPNGFEVRPVTPVTLTREAAYLRSGLKPSEMVAVAGVTALKATWLGVGEEE